MANSAQRWIELSIFIVATIHPLDVFLDRFDPLRYVHGRLARRFD
jgi:hypothetical protein